MRRFPTCVLIAVILSLCAATARAHQNPFSYVDLHLYPDSLSGTASVHIEDLAGAVGVANAFELLVPETLVRQGSTLRAAVLSRLAFSADGVTVPVSIHSIESVLERSLITFHFHAPWNEIPAILSIQGPLFSEDPQHQTYVNFYVASDLQHQDLMSANDHEVEFVRDSERSVSSVIGTFVYEGIHHIFIGPDHILFIIGLLLLGGGLKRLLKIVTAFTVAHSITLVLATLEILNPSPRVIEPTIALSIVFVGVENFFAVRHERDWRVPIAFSFGFVHGFGFASVLREFGLPGNAVAASLFAFNIGVEIGQAVIVLLVAPLLAVVSARFPTLRNPIIAVGSSCVVLAGGYWFIQRVFGS